MVGKAVGLGVELTYGLFATGDARFVKDTGTGEGGYGGHDVGSWRSEVKVVG